ncbi:MAG: bifunctional nuclease family protein [Deltaproteobacteria bacterium]|nr:MAG: bifunctional nuclease family protein [Deltaproteobacteria bacterium]
MVPRRARFCILVALCTGCAHGASGPAASAAKAVSEPAAPPPGFSPAVVLGVLPNDDGSGHFVLLGNEATGSLLAITVGQTEALAIHLRMQRRRFERPLTHDLLDQIVERLGGHLLKVQVDDLKGDTFVGSIFLEAAGRVHVIDARPSDAIALAVGNRVPIFVSDEVMHKAGITRERLEELQRELEKEEEKKREPEGNAPTPLGAPQPGRNEAPATRI